MKLRVKDICKAQGITLKELAGKLGISEVALRKSLAGNPTIGTLEKIANELGVDISELFAPVNGAKIICPHCGKIISIKTEV